MGIVLTDITADDLNPLIGEEFGLSPNEGEAPVVMLRLAEVLIKTGVPEGLPRAPFSLLFKGSAQEPVSQGMFWFSHRSLDELPIFIVPIRGDAETRTYEAVFN